MFTLRVAKPQPHYVTYRERYKVDLPSQMAECEANYLRLFKLISNHQLSTRLEKLSDLIVGEQYRFIISHAAQQWLHQIHIIEQSPYTTTLKLTQTSLSETSTWLQMPRLTVRMYHDAKLAEVLAWEGHRRLRPRYEYPNEAMYHADEKMQINQFLSELLTNCLRDGLAIDNAEIYS